MPVTDHQLVNSNGVHHRDSGHEQFQMSRNIQSIVNTAQSSLPALTTIPMLPVQPTQNDK